MKLSNELTAKAKKAKNAEEIAALAKENGIELTEKEAEKAFANLNKKGELEDSELNNVAGGCGSIEDPKFSIGQRVKFTHGSRSNIIGVITERSYAAGWLNSNCWIYDIKCESDDSTALYVKECNISAM